MARSFSGKARVLATLVVLGVLMNSLTPVHARPSDLLSRQKRVSDQRLAELETLVALSKMKGKLVTVPVAFGVVDPAKIGRRRRSSGNARRENFQRILQFLAQHPDFVAGENDRAFPSPWDAPKSTENEVF